MSRPRALLALGACVAFASSRTLAAQSGDVLTVGVPESPAFTFLGVSPTKVTRPTTPRDLGAGILSGIDSTGKFQSGFALNATLWSIPGFPGVSLHTYQHSPWARILATTQLSLGAVRATGDTAATDIAIGLRSTLYDEGDLMKDAAFTDAYKAKLDACASLHQPPPLLNAPAGKVKADSADAATTCASKAADSLYKSWSKQKPAGLSAAFGTAFGWRYPQSTLSTGGRALGASAWLNGAAPLTTGLQLLGLLKYDFRTAVDTGGASQTLNYGVRAIAGSSSKWDTFVEVMGTGRLQTSKTMSRSNAQWSGGVEFQVSDQYWISTGFGQRYTSFKQPDRIILIANVRWGISSAARFFTAKN